MLGAILPETKNYFCCRKSDHGGLKQPMHISGALCIRRNKSPALHRLVLYMILATRGET